MTSIGSRLIFKKDLQLTIMKLQENMLRKTDQSLCAFTLLAVKSASHSCTSTECCWLCLHGHLTNKVKPKGGKQQLLKVLSRVAVHAILQGPAVGVSKDLICRM